MKILLVIPRYNLTNSKRYNYSFPLGLAYIHSSIKKGGYDLDCINLNHLDGTISDLLNKKLSNTKYDFICTGHMCMGYHIIKEIITTTHSHETSPKVILGGAIMTSEPEFMFNLLKPDYGVLGEGEITIVELLKCIEENGNLKDVNGIIYLDKDELIITEKRKLISNLDTLPFPDLETFEFKEKVENSHTNDSFYSNVFDFPRPYPILCSRGCPFQCTFCYHSLGRGYRIRSVKNIIKELREAMEKYQVNLFNFHDDLFAVDKKRLFDLCNEIKKLINQFPWECKWMCQMTTQNVDEEMLKMLKDAGCILVSYGFESYSPEVLKSMRKPITPQQINTAINLTRKIGLTLWGNFIFGDIAESKKTADQTLNYWKENCCGQVGLDFIQPYPGSEIYKYCIRKGIIRDKVDFIKNIGMQNFFNMTKNMSSEEIGKLKLDILKALVKYRYNNSAEIISMKKTSENIYDVCVKCPFCKDIISYKNFNTKNKFYFMDLLICRNCKMHFIISSSLKKFFYAHYSLFQPFMRAYLKIRNKTLKKKI